jgi:orotidine-5'-phosphate decarboxylase
MGLDRLQRKIIEMGNPTVVGLDPLLDYVPNFIKDGYFEEDGTSLRAAAHAVFRFNQCIIDRIFDIVPAIKPQIAYYEMYGHHGIATYEKTIRYAKTKGMYVIGDAKRNDIGETMNAYAAAHMGEVTVGDSVYEPFGADALTVNPYLGTDTMRPLLDICKKKDKGIFVLVKTSNKSSGELQDLMFGDEPLYSRVGAMCEKWGEDLRGELGYSAVGAVVGATYPEQLAELRKKMPHTMFLVPGYGAQGGGAEDIAGAFDDNGIGAIVNSSRAIMCAYKNRGEEEERFAEAAREEAIGMRDAIRNVLKRTSISNAK